MAEDIRELCVIAHLLLADLCDYKEEAGFGFDEIELFRAKWEKSIKDRKRPEGCQDGE